MKQPRLKKPIVAALLALSAALTSADITAALQIYKVKGNVIVRKGNMRITASRRSNVVGSDLLTIPKDGAIDILDSKSHRIYSSTETGEMSVETLMKKAESHAANITRNINRKVIAAVADNADQKRSGYDTLGMTIHETDAIAHPPVDLPKGVSYLSYLLENVKDADSTHQSYISLSRVTADGDSPDFDAPYNFVLHNSMRQPLYFNVIEKDEKEGIHLFFPQNPVAAPQTETAASEYTYVPDFSTRAYVAIASDMDFTLEDVKKLLEADYNPDDDYYLTILTVK